MHTNNELEDRGSENFDAHFLNMPSVQHLQSNNTIIDDYEMDGAAGASEELTNQGQYPEYEWKCITKEFFDACSELSLGELIHDEVFGLFEAMSATEIMDPKMDGGMGFNRNEPPPHTFESAVKAGVLKIANLENEELIGLFDALFSCLVAWLEGHSLDQILFTCLYLHSPMSIEDKTLRTFCLGIKDLTALIKHTIVICNVHEEEDFQLYGSPSLNFVNDTRIIRDLRDVEDELLKASKKNQSPEETLAVMHRLCFMRYLYQSLHLMFVRPSGSESQSQDIIKIQKSLNAALELVPLIRKTICKGTQPEEESEAPNPIGFSPRVNHRNLPPTFPRSVQIRERDSSMQFLEELIERLKLACKVVHQKDFYSALNFFIDFSKKAGHCLLSRSVLQNLYMDPSYLILGSIDFTDYLANSVRAFIAPPSLNPKRVFFNQPKLRLHVLTFLKFVKVKGFGSFLQICGYNRARQRDKIARLISESFAMVQDEANRLDSYLNVFHDGTEPPYFGTWTLYICLRAISLYLLSGFELELYSVHEFLYIYWYMFEFLFGFIISALTRAKSILLAEDFLSESSTQTLKSGSSKQRKPKKSSKQMVSYTQEIILNHALQNMSGGYYKLMGAFTKDGRIRAPMPKFDNEQIRYNHRFAPLLNLTSPQPIPYTEFVTMRDNMMASTSAELYLAAAKHFHQARTVLESLQDPDSEMVEMLKIAKINFIVSNLLANGHKKDSKTPPVFDFSAHQYFPIIRMN